MPENLPTPFSDEKLRSRIKETISRISRIPAAEFKDDVLIREELGIDSLMAMEIVATCEKELGVTIDEGELFALQTVGDFLRLVESIYRQQWARNA